MGLSVLTKNHEKFSKEETSLYDLPIFYEPRVISALHTKLSFQGRKNGGETLGI